MKLLPIAAALIGLLAGTCVVGYYGFGEVATALAAIRWSGFLLVCAYHLTLYVLLGLAWQVVVPPARRVGGLRVFIWGRLVRDSGSEVLPLSQIGGFVMGSRATMLLGLPAALAFASMVVDVTLELLAQLAYTGLGLGLLVWLEPATPLFHPIAIGLVVATAVAIAFVIAQRRGLGLIERLAKRLAREWLAGVAAHSARAQRLIHSLYRHRSGLQLGFGLHMLGWIANGVEAWIALHLMGVPLALPAVLAIESLLYAIRSVAFAVPNAVGVQEGAYVMLGAQFGLDPQTALALSLLKRGRDILIGVPALLVWQLAESRRLWRVPGPERHTEVGAPAPAAALETDTST